MTENYRRCRSCGSPLARDNPADRCGSCSAAGRDEMASAPAVPAEFWETEDLQLALGSCHMGQVIRAYRQHPFHGRRGLSQGDVAGWIGTSQGYISRLENGPANLRLDQLAYWARLLGIPKRYHWFKLPADRGRTHASTDPPEDQPARPGSATGLPVDDQAEPDADDRDRDAAALGSQPETPLPEPLPDLIAELRALVAEGRGSAPGQGEQGPRGTRLPQELTVPRRVRDKPAGQHKVMDSLPAARDRSRSAASGADMTRVPTADPTPTLPNPPIHIDIETAQPARIADYLLGGNANFSIDREVIEYIIAALPGGGDTARSTTRAAQAFQRRVVRFLAGEAGVRQFLNLSARIPPTYSVHETAQEIAPDARVVYVINDDVVLAHAHRLRASSAEGVTDYVRGDPCEPEKVLRDAEATLDFSLPVAIMVFGAVHIMGHGDAPYGTIARLLDGVPSGSYLVMTHLASDLLGEEMAAAVKRLDNAVEQQRMMPLVLRSHGEVRGFLDGLELVEPGVVPVDRWRPDDSDGTSNVGSNVFIYGAVGRKP